MLISLWSLYVIRGVNLWHTVSLHVAILMYQYLTARAVSRVQQIGANATGPANLYHSICLILWFQFDFVDTAVTSLFGRTAVSTKQMAKSSQCFSKIAVSYLRAVCNSSLTFDTHD